MPKISNNKITPDPWDSGALGRDEQYVVVVDKSFDVALANALALASEPIPNEGGKLTAALELRRTTD